MSTSGILDRGRRPADVPEAVPAAFSLAVAAVRRATVRAGVIVEEVPAPRRIAPFAHAVTARLETPDGADDERGDEAMARFVLLHDPAMPEGWSGDQRVVAFLTAPVERDLAGDPLLADVAWTWLVEELDEAGAERVEFGGTVTRVSSSSFGVLGDRVPTDQVEVRASWTPVDDLAVHVEGWAAALCRLAGVPPVVPGLLTLPRRP